MSVYSKWTELAQIERAPKEHKEFWQSYFDAEQGVYEKLLEQHQTVVSGKLSELAERFEMDIVIFTGFMDGINTSLKKEYDLEKLKESTAISLDLDFEKLYYNMLEAKAEWLYNLEQWDDILTKEKRREIASEHRRSKMFVADERTGRNDPCPCGSGKKYKKCCGKLG
ncbi:MAG: SEC-C metal-binding domain-containing protein [Christensenellales bacterium]|jgi:uncharacterized protein YecA (UPF0149 family)